MQWTRISLIVAILALILPACGKPAETKASSASPPKSTQNSSKKPQRKEQAASTGTANTDPVAQGKGLFQSHRCWFCHNVTDAPPKFGPNLTRVGATLKRDALTTWIKNPKALKPRTTMPSFTGTPDELEQLVEYMSTLR
jgi:cytochrome c2